MMINEALAIYATPHLQQLFLQLHSGVILGVFSLTAVSRSIGWSVYRKSHESDLCPYRLVAFDNVT